MKFFDLCVQRQAAAVGVLLRIFRFSVLAFEVGDGHIERFVTEADSDGVHRDPFFVQGIGVGLREAVKFGPVNPGFLRHRLRTSAR